MTAQPTTDSRYHALDSLRAAMMFLGIHLHVVVAYSPSAPWLYKPAQLTTTLDYTMVWIHVFRMPVFYVMAGFFTALLLQRYGARRAAWNRVGRIVVPFIVGWIIVYPLSFFLAAWGRRDLSGAVDFMLSGRFLIYLHPLHLWFLEYLIVFYVLAAIVVFALPFVLPEKGRALATGLFRSIVQSWWAPLPFAVLSFLPLLLMKWPGLEDPVSPLPMARLVLAYGIPFAFGWLLYGNADLLDTFRRRAWPYAVLAGFASVAYLVLLYSSHDRGVMAYASRAAHALAMWLLIFGVIGLFLRYLSGHSAPRRYLCDSSYFLYIAHFPLIIAFQILLKDVPAPPLVKMALVLLGVVAVLLPLYRYGVRPTFIGAVLNGRKYFLAPASAVAAAD